MSSKQCSKCGRFKGANHSCPTLQVKSPAAPSVKAPLNKPASFSIAAPAPARNRSNAPVRPNAAKVQAILQDAKRIESAIKAIEFSVGTNSQNPSEAQKKMRTNLEATFGRIDWNA
jgi:hypothetical protein